MEKTLLLLAENIIKEDSFKNLLRDYLAEKVSAAYHFKDEEGLLIKKEVRNLIKEEAKTMIKEVVEEYYELSELKILVADEIAKLNKNNILELLKDKFKTA